MTTSNATKEFEESVKAVLPADCLVSKIEFEGPQLVLYLKNMEAFYRDENLITRIASKVRKKVVVRADSSLLMPPEPAIAKIKEIIPVEAGVKDIRFDPPFNEVIIEADKPGVVIGKGGSVLKSIVLSVGWSPKVLRAPTMPSETEAAVRGSLLSQSEYRKKFLTSLGKKMMANVLVSGAITNSASSKANNSVQPNSTAQANVNNANNVARQVAPGFRPVQSNGASSPADWIKFTALGAFREIGRSCFLLQTPKSNVLVDCGMNADTSDPSRNYPYLNAMGISLDEIDAMILSHAHMDHMGFIPYLYAYGYEGPLYCTPPTRDLMVLLQQDGINVINSENGKAPYGERDIKKELAHVITREYGEVTDVTDDIRFTFHNAGHMLGSAMVHLHIGEGGHNLVYSADIRYGRTRVCDPATTNFPRCETLILEATYGGRNDIKPRQEEYESRLIDLVRKTIANRGKVLIPVISSGRAQEIQLVLEEHLKEPNFPVYLDGMSRESSAIHTVYPEYLRHNVQRRILQNDSPFDKPMFKTVINKDQRKTISESDEPCVILAPSGMLTGGPSVEFLKMLCSDPRNALIFVGYQSAMSFGRKLQQGEREIPVLNSANKQDTLKINMGIHSVDGFSGHSDRAQLMAFARNIRPRPSRILTNHGDDGKCEDLARGLAKMLGVETRVPMNLDSIRLK